MERSEGQYGRLGGAGKGWDEMGWDGMGWESGVIAERGKSVLARGIHPEF